MRHRTFRISLLCFVAVWLGVIVPSHKRGQITLAGWRASCCTVTEDHARTQRKPVSTPSPASCAICQFIAVLDLPVTIQSDVPPLLAQRPVAWETHPLVHSIEFQHTCQARAPPIA